MPDSVSCHSCGRGLSEGDKFCPGCGTTVAEPSATVTIGPEGAGTNQTQCVKCAAPMGRDDRFCPSCGTSRPEEATMVSHVSLRNSQAAHLIEATEGEFEIVRQLGTGAMGAVYLAKDIALGREVAIKVIAPNLLSDETMVSRFRMEAQTVAALHHPNIVNVHAVRQRDDLHFFVMQFIDGPTLRSIVKGHAPLDVDIVQSLLFQVGSALSYAHRTKGGVIHRDIKPANIIVDQDGNAFVTDFGISKIAEAQTGLTQTGATIGTPEYMSPEQCRGDGLTGASDQYALGIVAYEMLTGQTPFSGNQYHIMVAHTSEPPKPVRDLRPDCPGQVSEAVERMLAKSPDERWPDLDAAVTGMGGVPLPYNSPTRTKIVTLTGATLVSVPAVDTDSSASPGSADTATSVTVTGIPSVVETGDRFTLAADVRGDGEHSLTGLGVEWASTDPSIVKVDGGLVEALQPGSVSITAMAGNVASSVLLTVAEPSPATVLVRPGSVTIQQGGRIGLAALVQDRKGRTMDREVAWSTSDPAIATVADGEVVATGSGTVSIVAESEGVEGTAEVVVEAPAETPAPAPAPKPSDPKKPSPVGAPTAASAPAAAPTPQRAPRPKSAPSAAPTPSVAQQPLYRRPAAIAAGVVLVALVGIGVVNVIRGGPSASEPGSPTLGSGVGETVGGASPASPPSQASGSPATGADATGGGVDGVPPAAATADATGGTSSPEPAPAEPETVEPEPTTTAAADASDGGDAPPPASTTPAAAPPPAPAPAPTPASVEITLATAAMAVGGSQDIRADVLSAGGERMTSGFQLAWRSTDPDVLSVDTRGRIQADGAGAAWVVAVAGSARDSALITVEAVPTAVEIAQSDLALEMGGTAVLSASVLDSDGNPLGGEVRWLSSNPAVASVDSGTGRVTAGQAGTARITASAEGLADEIDITVELALPSASELQSALGDYLTLLSSGDEDRVRALWEGGEEDGLNDLLDLMDERDFAASLGPVGNPTARGGAAVVTFQITGSYRNFAGGSRQTELSLVARLEPSGSGWSLVSAVAP